MLYVRKAKKEDLERIMEIYTFAQEFMIRTGNPNQWGTFHPAKELIASDIEKGISRVIYDENGVHGVFAAICGEEPTYARIEGGSWLNDEPYLTIHRIAGDGQVRGLFSCALGYCVSVCPNIRIDTHEDNRVMRRLIEKNGFVRCGIIYVANGTPRIAYQRTAGNGRA